MHTSTDGFVVFESDRVRRRAVGWFWDKHAVAYLVPLVFAAVCLRVAASWDDLPILLTAGHIGGMLLA